MSLQDSYSLIIKSISEINGVLSIGKSGGEKLPEPIESDIDIFVFCDTIPDSCTRMAAIKEAGSLAEDIKISETGGKFWGICDFVTLDGSEICLMYFTASEMETEIASVLDGSRLDREAEYFYPTGRCATLLSMHILYNRDGFISAMKERLSVYPNELAEKLYNHHSGKISNEEDFERAVSRRDVLFYHATLECAIDHFLQALFALNLCFFPSRKRTLQFIETFGQKPNDCSERLLKIIMLGASPDTLPQSYDEWKALCRDLS